MPLLDIKIYDDPVLREAARPIDRIEPRHRDLARDMTATMYHARGIGLAANQVGVLERIVVVDTDWSRSDENGDAAPNPTVMINPEILEESVEDEVLEEGCLSIPGIEGEVWRPRRIRVRYRTLEDETVEEACEGLRARCILHEIDHIDGVLFIDRMGKIKRKLLNGPLRRLARERRENQQD